jgi:hypothetical protein
LQGQVPCDVDVCCAHLVTGRQIGQGQGRINVLRHQGQHPGVKAAHGVAQQATQVRLTPAGSHSILYF